jgi:hypothetical protein
MCEIGAVDVSHFKNKTTKSALCAADVLRIRGQR